MLRQNLSGEELEIAIRVKTESRLFKISSYIFWIALLWASTERASTGLGVNYIFIPLQNLFVASNDFYNFPGFELFVIYFCFMLTRLFSNYYTKQHRIINLFLIITFIVTFINYINPNNNYSVGFYSVITAKITRTFWFMLPFAYALLYLNNRAYLIIVKKLLSIGLKVATSRVLFALFAVLIGAGQRDLFGKNLSIYQSDILAWLSFFSVYCFTVYLIKKQNKYGILSLLFLLCNILSYRRTALLVTIGSGIIIYVYYLIVINKKIKNIYLAGAFFLLIAITGPLLYNKSQLVFDLTNRYVAAISFTGIANVDETVQGESEYTDSGHVDQAVNTWNFFLKNLGRFWGTGIRVNSKSFWVEGRSEAAVHNNIVYSWSRYGMYMVVYYVLVFITLFRILFRVNSSRSFRSLNGFICFSTFIYLAMYFVGGWFSGGTFFESTQVGIEFIFLYSVMKISFTETIHEPAYQLINP
jgi:hypothetical protein